MHPELQTNAKEHSSPQHLIIPPSFLLCLRSRVTRQTTAYSPTRILGRASIRKPFSEGWESIRTVLWRAVFCIVEPCSHPSTHGEIPPGVLGPWRFELHNISSYSTCRTQQHNEAKDGCTPRKRNASTLRQSPLPPPSTMQHPQELVVEIGSVRRSMRWTSEAIKYRTRVALRSCSEAH